MHKLHHVALPKIYRQVFQSISFLLNKIRWQPKIFHTQTFYKFGKTPLIIKWLHSGPKLNLKILPYDLFHKQFKDSLFSQYEEAGFI